MPNFSFLYWFLYSQLFAAATSCWQLMKADIKKINWNFIPTLKVMCMPNFSSLGWISFSSTIRSCHQLLTAFDSWWKPSQKKFNFSFYAQIKSDIHAKFQLSRLIFIFVTFYQLSSAVDSCWQLLTADNSWYEKI